MRACGQKLVKLCTLTHTMTHAAKLVVKDNQMELNCLCLNVCVYKPVC